MELQTKNTNPKDALLEKSDNDEPVCFSHDDVNTKCGLGSCQPRGLQVFANMAAFTGFYSIAGLLSSTLLSYVNSQVTTLERQFGLSSSESGLIMASNDFGYVLVVIFVGYFATRVHIPRTLGFCTVLFGISGLICCLPHFLFGVEMISGDVLSSGNLSQPANQTDIPMCSFENYSLAEICEMDEGTGVGKVRRPRDHAQAALALIMLGMALQGMAKAPRNPFTITFVDSNVQPIQTSFFVGIIIGLSIFGPAVSFSLGSYFTRLYVTLQETDLYPRHPRWIGAWWLGYLVFGATALVVGVPLFFFPRRLKSAPSVPYGCKTEKEIKTTKRFISEIRAAIFTLTFAGSYPFMPKYLETQFGLPAWKANLLIGTMYMCLASCGTFIGGWFMKRFKLSPLKALKINGVITFLTLGFVGLGFVFGCDQPEILKHPRSVSDDLNPTCNSNCHCSDHDFFPICGSDGINYFSPCYAGCIVQTGSTFYNCTCISDGGRAQAGLCEYDCSNLYPYVIANGVDAFTGCMVIMSDVIGKIRSVEENEKALCIGLSAFVTSVFGWLLGPIIFGRIVDTTCLVWDWSCGQRGTCALYDLADFRVTMHGYTLGGRFLGFLSLAAAIFIATKTKCYEKHEHPKTREE